MAAQYQLGNQVTTPPTAPALTFEAGGSLGAGAYSYCVSFLTNLGETMPGNSVTGTAAAGERGQLASIPIGPSNCIGRKLYRTLVGGAVFRLVAIINNNTTTTYIDTASDAALAAAAPLVTTDNVDPLVVIGGTLDVTGYLRQTVSSVSGAAGTLTCNGSGCMITVTGLTTLLNANSASTIKNNYVSASSSIIATLNNYSGTLSTNGIPVVSVSGIALGSFTLNISNAHATNALAGDVTVFVQIIN